MNIQSVKCTNPADGNDVAEIALSDGKVITLIVDEKGLQLRIRNLVNTKLTVAKLSTSKLQIEYRPQFCYECHQCGDTFAEDSIVDVFPCPTCGENSLKLATTPD